MYRPTKIETPYKITQAKIWPHELSCLFKNLANPFLPNSNNAPQLNITIFGWLKINHLKWFMPMMIQSLKGWGRGSLAITEGYLRKSNLFIQQKRIQFTTLKHSSQLIQIWIPKQKSTNLKFKWSNTSVWKTLDYWTARWCESSIFFQLTQNPL